MRDLSLINQPGAIKIRVHVLISDDLRLPGWNVILQRATNYSL
jgi:hypothetical protein